MLVYAEINPEKQRRKTHKNNKIRTNKNNVIKRARRCI